MKILNTKSLKENIIEQLKNKTFDNKILLLSKNPTSEVNYYKKAIIKRCQEFRIEYIDKVFYEENQEEILSFINSFDKEDGFIILAPFANNENLDYLKENILIKDLDSFTYKSLGKCMDGKLNSLPATPRAIIKFMDSLRIDYKGKNIIIANNTNIIGRPLCMYLSYMKASVSILNSSSTKSKELIRNCDIFISAIGKAKFYDASYFTDNTLIIDVGTSFIKGKIIGDVDFDSIRNKKVLYLGSKGGIGAITTVTLVEGLSY